LKRLGRTGAIVVSLKKGKTSAEGKDVGVLGENHLVSEMAALPRSISQEGQEMRSGAAGVSAGGCTRVNKPQEGETERDTREIAGQTRETPREARDCRRTAKGFYEFWFYGVESGTADLPYSKRTELFFLSQQ
jgi:hypothetical protein